MVIVAASTGIRHREPGPREIIGDHKALAKRYEHDWFPYQAR